MAFIFYFKNKGLSHPTMKELQITGVFAESTGRLNRE